MYQNYRLHYAPDNASLIVRLVLEELGQPYETALVDRRKEAQKSGAYRKINPAARIPALETPSGILFETAAILLWLSERHSALAPQPGDTDRGDFLKWLFYVSNTLHANLRVLFYPGTYTETHRSALQDGARANLTESLALLENEATFGHRWLNAKEPSVLDFYLASTMRWMGLYPSDGTSWFSLTDWPSLHALAARLETRPSTQLIAVHEGLGARPFTAPQPCNPQEGSAL